MVRTIPGGINGLPKKPGMIWHHILIAILIIVSILNFFYGSRVIGAKHYGSAAEAEAMYFYFPGLQTVDSVFGWFCVALATLGFIIAYLLYRKKKQGPLLLNLLLLLNAAAQILYLVAVILVMSKDAGYNAEMIKQTLGQMLVNGTILLVIFSVAITVAMIVINRIYYGKRKEMFS